MLKLWAYIFLFIFCFQQGSEVIYLCSFYLQRAELTLKFCVNKDKSEMACKASCHLKKELRKQNKEKSERSMSLNDSHRGDLLMAQDHVLSFVYTGNDSRPNHRYINNLYPDPSFEILCPPG